MNTFVFTILMLAPQEDLDTEMERLADKVATPVLAELLKSDAGRLVLKERMAALVEKAVARVDRDPNAWYERALFTEDADGLLHLRSERRAELDELARDVSRRVRGWEAFAAAAKEVAAKIPRTGPIEKKLGAYWENAYFIRALYHRLGVDYREPDTEQLWNRLVGRSLFRGNDGKLRLRGNYLEETLAVLNDVKTEAESLAAYDEGVAKVGGAASAEARVLLARRLAVLQGEGAEDPAAKFAASRETEMMALQAELAGLAELAKDLRSILARAAQDLAGESGHDLALKKLAADPRSAVLFAIRMKTTLDERATNRASAIQQFRDDYFEADELGALTLKKGRFADDQGNDSVDVLVAELDGVIVEAAANEGSLEEIVERAADGTIAALFSTKTGASAIVEHRGRLIEGLKQAERDGSFRKFMAGFLEKSGDRWTLRPARAGQVEELARRAKEIQARLDKAAREGGDR